MVILLFGGLYFFNSKGSKQASIKESPPTVTKSQSTNYIASFAIYTNGTFRIFEDSRYHNLSEEIYIDSSNPNVIQIKKGNFTWSDFFKTLPMKIEKDCLTTGTGQLFCSNQSYKLQFFINGNQDPNALEKTIKPNDKLLVTYEQEDSEVIKEQIKSVPDIN